MAALIGVTAMSASAGVCLNVSVAPPVSTVLVPGPYGTPVTEPAITVETIPSCPAVNYVQASGARHYHSVHVAYGRRFGHRR